MRWRVVLTEDARRDLESIYDHYAETASLHQAERIAERLVELAAALAQAPERGTHPRALVELGITEFRQIVAKPWLIVYGVESREVVVYLIADGRRDMRSLLAERLLREGR